MLRHADVLPPVDPLALPARAHAVVAVVVRLECACRRENITSRVLEAREGFHMLLTNRLSGRRRRSSQRDFFFNFRSSLHRNPVYGDDPIPTLR